MPSSDPRDWGLFAQMVCTHTDECARPRYMRGTIGWTPWSVDVLGNVTGFTKTLLTFIYHLFPAIFGGKVVVCATCNQVVFLHKMSRVTYRFLRFIHQPEKESILFLDEDVHRMGEFADQLDLEYVGDENG